MNNVQSFIFVVNCTGEKQRAGHCNKKVFVVLLDQQVTQPLEYLDISVLRQFLRHEFAELLEPKADVNTPAAGIPGMPPQMEEDQDRPDLQSAAAANAAPIALDFERLLEDFVLLTFLVSPAAWKT